MWNPLTRVAENQFLDTEKFINFATSVSNSDYGIVDGEINTWNVDKLLSDYKIFIGPENYAKDRQAAIDKLIKR